MSLRGPPLEQPATLPDGRELVVRIGVPDDSYVPRRERDLVAVEIFEDGRGIAAVDTLLEPDETSDALLLLRELVAGLESGELEPTAAAVERIVDR